MFTNAGIVNKIQNMKKEKKKRGRPPIGSDRHVDRRSVGLRSPVYDKLCEIAAFHKRPMNWHLALIIETEFEKLISENPDFHREFLEKKKQSPK